MLHKAYLPTVEITIEINLLHLYLKSKSETLLTIITQAQPERSTQAAGLRTPEGEAAD